MLLHSPLEQFKINPVIGCDLGIFDHFFPNDSLMLLGWIDLSFTNSALAMVLACTIFLIFRRSSYCAK